MDGLLALSAMTQKVVPQPSTPARPRGRASIRRSRRKAVRILRRPKTHPESDSISVMRVSFNIPPTIWYGRFSRSHPELALQVVNVAYLDDGEALGEFEIRGSPVDWTSELVAFADVLEAESLEIRPDLGRYRVRFRQSHFSAVWKRLDFLARFPRIVANGTMTCEAIAWKSRMGSILATLSVTGVEPRLVALTPVQGRKFAVSPRAPLSGERARVVRMTPVQRALFRQALSSGYFDVPRRITLSELAKKVSRSKSSVSVTLTRIERNLAEAAAAEGV
jgi:hypothetical protein